MERKLYTDENDKNFIRPVLNDSKLNNLISLIYFKISKFLKKLKFNINLKFTLT